MSNRINPMDQGLLGKIGDKIGDAGGTRKVGGDAGARGNEASRQPDAADTVELTSRARLLEQLEKTLASQPAVDGARVAAVREQIESGQYEVNAENLADAIIRSEQELGD